MTDESKAAAIRELIRRKGWGKRQCEAAIEGLSSSEVAMVATGELRPIDDPVSKPDESADTSDE